MITVADAKAQLNIESSNTDYDTELQVYVDGTTAVVERARKEVVTQREITEEQVLRNQRVFYLKQVPAQSLTSVATVDGSQTWNVADLHVSPGLLGRVTVLSGPRLDGFVVVTYTAGYTSGDVPGNYTLAARIIVQHLWQTQRGTAGAPLPGGSGFPDERVMAQLPRDVWTLLGGPTPVVA